MRKIKAGLLILLIIIIMGINLCAKESKETFLTVKSCYEKIVKGHFVDHNEFSNFITEIEKDIKDEIIFRLIRAISKEAVARQRRIIDALQIMEATSSLTKLKDIINDKNYDRIVRAQAITAYLSVVQDKKQGILLAKQVLENETNDWVKMRAAEGLGNYKSYKKEASDILISSLQTEKGHMTRSFAISALKNLGYELIGAKADEDSPIVKKGASAKINILLEEKLLSDNIKIRNKAIIDFDKLNENERVEIQIKIRRIADNFETNQKDKMYAQNFLSKRDRIYKESKNQPLKDRLVMFDYSSHKIALEEFKKLDKKIQLEYVPFLIRCLKHHDSLIQGKAVYTLSTIGKDIKKELIKIIKNKKYQTAAPAIQTLGNISPPVLEAIPILTNLLNSKKTHPNIRWHSVVALGKMGHPTEKTVSTLVKTLNDHYGIIRWAALKTLNNYGKNIVIKLEILMECLNDTDWRVRAEAVKALGRVGARAIPILLQAIAIDKPNTTFEIIKVLGQMRENAVSSVTTLIKIIDWPLEGLHEEVISTLKKIGTDEALREVKKYQ